MPDEQAPNPALFTYAAASTTRRSAMAKPVPDARQENLQTITDALALRPDGPCILCQCSTAEIFAACEPLPPRLLLGHYLHTKLHQRQTIKAETCAHALLALLPAFLLAAFLYKISQSGTLGWAVFILVMLGVPARTFWRERRKPGGVSQRAEWLDFTNRTWNSGVIYPDGSLPPVQHSQPFEKLALVCFTRHWEQGDSYEVALCEAASFRTLMDHQTVEWLNLLHDAESEQAAAGLTLELARLWNLPAWQDQHDGKGKRKPVRLI